MCDIWIHRLPLFSKLQYYSLAFVAGLKRATDEGSLPEIAQYSPYYLPLNVFTAFLYFIYMKSYFSHKVLFQYYFYAICCCVFFTDTIMNLLVFVSASAYLLLLYLMINRNRRQFHLITKGFVFQYGLF